MLLLEIIKTLLNIIIKIVDVGNIRWLLNTFQIRTARETTWNSQNSWCVLYTKITEDYLLVGTFAHFGDLRYFPDIVSGQGQLKRCLSLQGRLSASEGLCYFLVSCILSQTTIISTKARWLPTQLLWSDMGKANGIRRIFSVVGLMPIFPKLASTRPEPLAR